MPLCSLFGYASRPKGRCVTSVNRHQWTAGQRERWVAVAPSPSDRVEGDRRRAREVGCGEAGDGGRGPKGGVTEHEWPCVGPVVAGGRVAREEHDSQTHAGQGGGTGRCGSCSSLWSTAASLRMVPHRCNTKGDAVEAVWVVPRQKSGQTCGVCSGGCRRQVAPASRVTKHALGQWVQVGLR